MPRGGMAARGPPVGVLRSAAHRRAESRFWGVFIIAVHRAFVLGLGAQHRGIVELSEDRDVCDSVRLLYLLTYLETRDLVVLVVYSETLAGVVRPTDSTHQPGKPIFSGRYHRRFFGARQVRGRDQRAIPRQPIFIGHPTYVRPRGC